MAAGQKGGQSALPTPVLSASPNNLIGPRPCKRTWLKLTIAAVLLTFTASTFDVLPIARHGASLNTSHSGSKTYRKPSASQNPAYLVKAHNGAVASENRVCSELGVSTLKQGGNAVDAIVATTLCIGVLNMYSSGIGGGGFMTVRIPPKVEGEPSEVFTIDFRETAPALANETMYEKDPMSAQYGGLASGVPGELRGLEEAHKRWGSLPWKTLVQPSVDLAKGWKVDAELAKRMRWYPEFMLEDEDWRNIFAPEGRFLNEGEIIRRTNLSRTLSIIAEEGADAFYNGIVGSWYLDKVRATGGIMTHRDLQDYQVIVRPALEGTFHGRKIYTTHAPTSGPVLLHILNLIEPYEFKERNGLNTHRFIEALKFGFSARTRVCDPRFLNSSERIDRISTKEYAEEVSKNITDDLTHPPEYYQPEYDVAIDHGTSHTSVVDRDGMAVALTSTVNAIFGSRVLDPISGVILNNEMDDFSIPGVPNGFGLRPSPYNYPQPGKRPLSSTAPTIIEYEDGSFYLAIGGAGGSRIFGAIYQTLLNLDWGMDASEAVEFGRLHNQLYPLTTDADSIYPTDILEDLRSRGHNITIRDVNRVAAVVQLVTQQDGVYYAASDSRKNGVAAGW